MSQIPDDGDRALRVRRFELKPTDIIEVPRHGWLTVRWIRVFSRGVDIRFVERTGKHSYSHGFVWKKI